MSVSSVGDSIPDPGYYSYPATAVSVPAGDAPSTKPATSTVSPYVAEYNQLLTDDASELMSVSFGSTASASSNVASVLAQAAQLQDSQLAQQQAQTAAAAEGAVQSVTSAPSTANDPLGSLPSYTSILNASDSDANGAIDQYVQNLGTGVDTLA